MGKFFLFSCGWISPSDLGAVLFSEELRTMNLFISYIPVALSLVLGWNLFSFLFFREGVNMLMCFKAGQC